MVLKKINFARLFFVGVLTSSLISVVSCESGSLDGEVTEFTNGPGAFFTTTLSGEDNLTANFTADSSLNAASYEWDFGDGVGTSSDANPEYVYSENGEFTVTLTTVDSDGVTTVSTQVISVVEADEPEVDVPTGVQPTFDAVILNGGFEDFIWASGIDPDGNTTLIPDPDDTSDPIRAWDNDQDNADSFNMDPPGDVKTNEFVDNDPSPYTWENTALAEWLIANVCDDNVGPGITGSSNTGGYAISLADASRRFYQPFAVEVGVEYTITLFVRKQSTNPFNIYILNNPIANENNLEGNSNQLVDGTFTYVVTDGDDVYNEHSFSFIATTEEAIFYGVPSFVGETETSSGDELCEFGNSQIRMDDISIVSGTNNGGGSTEGGGSTTTATFAAEIMNGDAEDFEWREGTNSDGSTTDIPDPDDSTDPIRAWDNDQDNADAFNMDPPGDVKTNEFVDASPSPYTWENTMLETWLENNVCDDDYGPSTTTSPNTGAYAFTLSDAARRMYQPFAVEVGVEYTITLFVRKQSTNPFNIYILNNPIENENDLEGNSNPLGDDTFTYVVTDGDDVYNEHSFSFRATTEEAIFYGVPSFDGETETSSGDELCEFGNSQIRIDDISISTPGF